MAVATRTAGRKLVVSMRTEGVEEILERLREIVPQADSEISNATIESARRCESDAAARVAPSDQTGEIRSKLKTTFRKRRGRLVATVRSSARHSFFVEFGTGTMMRLSPEARREGFKPGKMAAYFPRVGKRLIEWVLRRTGSFFPGRRVHSIGGKKAVPIGREEAQQAAFLVARAIKRKGGTPARPWLFPAWGREFPRYLFALRAIGRGIGRRRGRR